MTSSWQHGILVFNGVWLAMAAVSIFVHDLGSRELRVKFGAPVESADNPAAYLLAAAGSEHVPTVTSAAYYDADKMSVVLTLAEALTRFGSYTCAAVNLWSSSGLPVTATPFAFVAVDCDKPVALGAFLSARGCIDVVFDRPVASTSVSAMAVLGQAGGVGPGVAMTLVPWTSGRSEQALRFAFAGAPACSAFEVRFAGAIDASGNVQSGIVPVTLARPAAGYADLVQAAVTAAHLVDVSNAAQFATAVVRVYFSCPMLGGDVTNPAKWQVSQQSAHVGADPLNQITAADASDEPSLVALVNQAKAKLNSHFSSHAHVSPDGVHLVTTPDAIDFESALQLLQDEQVNFLAHLERQEAHLYVDELHPCDTPQVGDLYDAIAWANRLKASLNGHIEASYLLAFSTAYAPVGPITDFASTARAGQVGDPHTWFADLHLATSATHARLSVDTLAIRSEDLASTSSDTVEVQPYASAPAVLSAVPTIRGARVRTAGGVELTDADAIQVSQGGCSILAVASAQASLPAMLWAYNNVLHAYRCHIGDPSAPPYLGAKHRVLDSVNTVASGDYATVMDLGALMSRANALKAKLTAHVTSGTYHYGQDAPVDAPDATDAGSLASLLEELQTHLISHNSSGFAANGNVVQTLPLYHESPGIGIVSAAVRDLIAIETIGMLDGVQADFAVVAAKLWRSNRPNPASRIVPGLAAGAFIGTDPPPTLTSAVARAGLDHAAPDHYLLSDAVELYMSKPMRRSAIVPGVNVSIPGMTLLDGSWLSDRVASVRVAGMSATSYSVTVTGMRDLAGNPLYEDPGPS